VGCIASYYPLYDRKFEAALTLEITPRIFVTDH